jgi:hypothetical protein
MHIHTVELQVTLGVRRIRQFFEHQQWFTDHDIRQLRDAETDTIASDIYPVRGIRQAFLRRNPSSTRYFFFSVVVNMQALAINDTAIVLFPITEDNVTACERNFQSIHQQRSGIYLPPMREWSVQRIDYAYDVVTSHTPLYVLLAQRGRIPDGFSQREVSTGSFYLESESGDITFNYYDKENQIVQGGRFRSQDRLSRQAAGRLRCEVQCTGSKLHHILDYIRTHIGDEYDHGVRFRTFLHPGVSTWILQHYYSLAIGYDDYYSLERAAEIVRSGPGRRDRHRRIIAFLQLVNDVGSVPEAQACFIAGHAFADGTTVRGCRETLINILNHYLPAVGVNPVTIPVEWGIGDHLPNPIPGVMCDRD